MLQTLFSIKNQIYKQLKEIKMKKVIFAVIIACVTLTSCSTENSTSNATNNTSDSTSVQVGTVNKADSTQTDSIK